MRYSIYGLQVQSDRPIPGVLPASGVPGVDVRVWWGVTSTWPKLMSPLLEIHRWYVSSYLDERGVPALTVWKLAGGAYFRFAYTDGTQFLVDRAGTEIWAHWPNGLTLEDAATYLLGPILGFVLHLRGVPCLHASAIAVGDRAIAFLGPSGAGKSTTAAGFARAGYAVLSDDVVALMEGRRGFFVQPAYPRVRLWPASVRALYGTPDALPPLTPTWEKRYLDLLQSGDRFQARPLPLQAIYILDDRQSDAAAPRVSPVSAGTALITLVANSYATYLLDTSMRRHEFVALGRVAGNVPVRRVTPHTDLECLAGLCTVILDDVQALPCPGRAAPSIARG